jgi:hypothetical protein
MNKISFPGIIGAVTIGILPYVASRLIPYGTLNSKVFFIFWVTYVFTAIFAYYVISGKHNVSLRKRWLLLALMVVLVVHYIAAYVGVQLGRSLWSDLLRGSGVILLTHVGLLAFIWSELFRVKDWLLMKRALVGTTTLFSFLYFFSPEGLDKLAWLGKNYSIIGLTFGNSTFAGAFLLIGLVITVMEILRSARGSTERKVLVGALVVQLLNPLFFNSQLWRGIVPFSTAFKNPFLFFGTAQASAVTAYAVVVYVGARSLIKRFVPVTSKETVLKVLTWASGLIIAGLLISLYVPGSVVNRVYSKQSTAARPIVWKSALQGVAARPILGYGPENFVVPFEKYFDNRLYLQENIGEIWFDKAHNVLFDKLIDVGILGTLILLGAIIYLMLVYVRAGKRGVISKTEAHLWCILLVANFLQLQTSFDTASTYALYALSFGYGLWLERQMLMQDTKQSFMAPWIRYGIGAIAALIIVFGGINTVREHGRLRAIQRIFVTPDNAARTVYMEQAFSRTSSFEAIRLPAASLIKGLFGGLAERSLDQRGVAQVRKDLVVYEAAYKRYLAKTPDDYRVKINLAYLLTVESMLGDQKLGEAKTLISSAYQDSPQNPLTYVIDSLITLYQGKPTEAKQIIRAGIALNPSIPLTQRVLTYIEQQEKTLPEITFMKLENL